MVTVDLIRSLRDSIVPGALVTKDQEVILEELGITPRAVASMSPNGDSFDDDIVKFMLNDKIVEMGAKP